MNNTSSNKEMERVFNQLGQIKKAEISDMVYTNLKNKFSEPKVISWNWVRIAAAIFIGFIAIEVNMISNHISDNKTEALKELVSEVNYGIYYE